MSQAPGTPPQTSGAPAPQAAPQPRLATPTAAVPPQLNAAPPAPVSAVAKQPPPISIAILHRVHLRRAAARMGARGSMAPESAGDSTKQQPTSPATTKSPPPPPPAPKIPVSLEAAPPPLPSISTDGNSQPKPDASRRHSFYHPKSSSKARHKAGAAVKVKEKAKLVTASAAPGKQE
jgi:hypothetical protein